MKISAGILLPVRCGDGEVDGDGDGDLRVGVELIF